MTKAEVDQKLAEIGQDRHWLAEQTGYSYDTVRNSLAPKAKELSFAMSAKFERSFLEEERRRNVNDSNEETSIWDLVMFTGKEVSLINDARRIGGYQKVEDLFHDAVIEFCDSLIAKQSPETIATLQPENENSLIEFQFVGAAAAGQPVEAPRKARPEKPAEALRPGRPAGHRHRRRAAAGAGPWHGRSVVGRAG